MYRTMKISLDGKFYTKEYYQIIIKGLIKKRDPIIKIKGTGNEFNFNVYFQTQTKVL